MKLIKLHLIDNQPMWINPKNVCSVYGLTGHGAITFIGDDNTCLRVSETPEEIVKLLEESK